jgi:hypothetical protein
MHGRINIFILDTQTLFLACVADIGWFIRLVTGDGHVFCAYRSAVNPSANPAWPFTRIFCCPAQASFPAAPDEPAILAIVVCGLNMSPILQYLMRNGRRMPLKSLSNLPE